jgi:hypothetical protein
MCWQLFFYICRFGVYINKMIDLFLRICTVSVQTKGGGGGDARCSKLETGLSKEMHDARNWRLDYRRNYFGNRVSSLEYLALPPLCCTTKRQKHLFVHDFA